MRHPKQQKYGNLLNAGIVWDDECCFAPLLLNVVVELLQIFCDLRLGEGLPYYTLPANMKRGGIKMRFTWSF